METFSVLFSSVFSINVVRLHHSSTDLSQCSGCLSLFYCFHVRNSSADVRQKLNGDQIVSRYSKSTGEGKERDEE